MLNLVLIFSLTVIVFPHDAVSNEALETDKISEDHIDITNGNKNLRRVKVPFTGNFPYPAGVKSTLPQKESSSCEYSEILQKIWAVLSTYLNNEGAPKVEGPDLNKIRNTLTVVKKYVQDTPAGYQNQELLKKLQELEIELNKDVSAIPSGKKYLHDIVHYNPIINGNLKTDIVFKYELPVVNQESCKEAFMRLIQTARDAYIQVAQNPLCNNQILGVLDKKPDYLMYPTNQENNYISARPMHQKWQSSNIASELTKYPGRPENPNGLLNILPNNLQNNVHSPQEFLPENYLNPQNPRELPSNFFWQNNNNNGYNSIGPEQTNSYLLEKHQNNQEINRGWFDNLPDNLQNKVSSMQDEMPIPVNYLYSQKDPSVLPILQKWQYNRPFSGKSVEPELAHTQNKEQNNDFIHTLSYNLQNKNFNSEEAFHPIKNYLHPQTPNSELPNDQWQPNKNNGFDNIGNLQHPENNPNPQQNNGGSFDNRPDYLKGNSINPHIGHHLSDNYFKPQNLLNRKPNDDRFHKDQTIEYPHGDYVHQNNRWNKIENTQMNVNLPNDDFDHQSPQTLYPDENPMLEFTNIIPNPLQSYEPSPNSSYLHYNPIKVNGDVTYNKKISHGLYPSLEGNPYVDEPTNLWSDKAPFNNLVFPKDNKIDKPYNSYSNFPDDFINANHNSGPDFDSDSLSLTSYPKGFIPKDYEFSHHPATESPQTLDDSFEYNGSPMQQTLPQTSYSLPDNLLNKDFGGNPYNQVGLFQNGFLNQNQGSNQIPEFIPPDIVATGLANNYIGNNISESKFDSQQLQDVTNSYELKLSPNKAGIIELTYLLKKPKPVVYQPFYYVKYSMPYNTFVSNIRNLLVRKPYLRSDPVKLYQELISESNITEVSPDLKDYPKEQILKLVFNNGTLVNARVIKNDTKLQEQTKAIQDLNSKLQPDAQKLELSNLTMQYYNQMKQEKLEEHDLDKIRTENVKDDGMLQNAVPSLKSYSNTVVSNSNLTRNTDWIQKGNVNPTNENNYRPYSGNRINRLPSILISQGSALNVGQNVVKNIPFAVRPLRARQKTVINTSNNVKREISYGNLRQGYGFKMNQPMIGNYNPYYQPTKVPTYNSLNGMNPKGTKMPLTGSAVFHQFNPSMYSMARAGQQAGLNPIYTQNYPNVQPLLRK